MTRVEFQTGIADPADFACRLLRKAFRLGSRVLLAAPEPVLTAVDRALWVQDERDFVPHARLPGASAAVLLRTPLWLATQPPDPAALSADLQLPQVLVNLGLMLDADALPRYERVIEVVGRDPDDAQGGRERWRRYKALGLELEHRTQV